MTTHLVTDRPAATRGGARPRPPQGRPWRHRVGAAGVVALLAVISLFVGVAEVSPSALLDPATRDEALKLLTVSRLPRTAALVLAGSALAVAGLIMQLLTRNPFVEPTTAGTMEFAGAGLLLTALLAPEAPVVVRMVVGAVCALAGTALFLRILQRIPLRDILVVPLVGLMLSGIVAAGTTFLAYRYDLIQSMTAWTTGDFSASIAGRYEMLWVTAALVLAALVVADRFTVAGMGEEVTTNLGLNHRRTLAVGMSLVAVISAAVIVTVGVLPFIGLVVPNLVMMLMGGSARRTIPWVATAGAALVLVCDLLARTVRAPYEVPIGTVLGVVGGIVFVVLLLKGRSRVA